jgi:hypothetical protein
MSLRSRLAVASIAIRAVAVRFIAMRLTDEFQHQLDQHTKE